jgi:hypothetical protein
MEATSRFQLLNSESPWITERFAIDGQKVRRGCAYNGDESEGIGRF